MNTQSLTRTSAVIYADNYSSRKTETVKKKFIEAVFANNGNQAMTIEEIAGYLLDDMELSFTDKEIEAIVSDREAFVLQQVDNNKAHDKYNLFAKRYDHLKAKSSENIDECIKQYLLEKGKDEASSEGLRQLLERYLYSMMNSNIEAYSQVLRGKVEYEGKRQNGLVDPAVFDDEQIKDINDFLSWKNSSKDKELFKIVSCCIEYAIVANNSNEQALHKSLKNKILYIDNAFIYRAIGINGETRKKRTISFIKKCQESGQKLKVTKFSREEFHHSIDFHIQQLNRTTPFGRINPSLFQRYAYGETIYQYYHRWRGDRYTYDFTSFKAFVISEYNELLHTHGIEEDYKVPFDDKDEIPEVEKYADEIQSIKQRGGRYAHITDAKNMYWIEKARHGTDGRLVDTKYYFITPDQKLQFWDSHHSCNQPITLLPSQWLALLLKYTSRSNDDYKSFVSFLRLSHNETDMTAEMLQEILAGISEVTEDLQKQSDYLNVYMEEEWSQIRKGGGMSTLREDARRFVKDRMEEQFKQELERKSQEMARELDKQKQLNKEQIAELEKTYKAQLLALEKRNEKDRLSIKYDFIQQAINTAHRRLDDITVHKDQADEELNRGIFYMKLYSIITVIFLASAWIGVIFYFKWDKMEEYTYFLALVLALSSLIYLIVYEKSFSLQRTFVTIQKRKKDRIYKKYNVSDEIITECNNDIKALGRQLAEVKSKIDEITG
jgi:hypothetical protein